VALAVKLGLADLTVPQSPVLEYAEEGWRIMQNGNMQNEPPDEDAGRYAQARRRVLASELIQNVRTQMRMRHLAKRTEEAYVGWIVSALLFCKQQRGAWIHPNETDDLDINAFLGHLAVDRNVTASTQNQACSALLFLSSN
jgi:hypothetical protein